MPSSVASDFVEISGDCAGARTRRGTLLIVDDEEGPRQSLRVIFKDDYHILMADSGSQAIELAQDNTVDVAVLDIRMTGMSGIETLERLKAVSPDVQVIMMTAFETTDTIRQALRLRACDYINKPFDLSTVRAAVSHAMQRRTLESEIHDNEEKLQGLLMELQNQRIEEQIANTRGEIYASILHDINGPLTVISGFVQLMNQRFNGASNLGREDVDFLKERLKIITRQITNCIEISRRYLGFLRKQSDEAPRVGVNQLLADLQHLVNVHPALQQNTFVMQPLAEDIGVKINGTDLIQVLLNLIINAFQCTPIAHHVVISGTVLYEPLDLAAFRDDAENRFINVEGFDNGTPVLQVSVSDTGPGIPTEVLPRIFQPFFTTKGAKQGTGLGLNIVQRLVREGRGALHVRTQIGKGTTFTVYLPGARLMK
ncbi:MAG TPA: response regulator [Verrucomicrobiae bacterium]|nr:response regulator [Verrucomicrobiae bacterium]